MLSIISLAVGVVAGVLIFGFTLALVEVIFNRIGLWIRAALRRPHYGQDQE